MEVEHRTLGNSQSSGDITLTSFYDSDSLQQSVPPQIHWESTPTVVPNHSHDFLRFIAICQKQAVPLLNITWDRALEDNSNVIGIGMTAEIRPGTLNLKNTLAFKRLNDRSLEPSTIIERVARRHRAYQNLLSEIHVLSHPRVRNHPNILRLEGVCWDFPSTQSEDTIRPVLVFEKAQQGDLDCFLKSAHGKPLAWNQREKLCIDIARALACMHSCGIVHGDIKPKNVLVFSPSSTSEHDPEYIAKVSDFGYSTCNTTLSDGTDQRLVVLPWTVPWNAPEVHRGNCVMSAEKAKRADIFSFGMTCLWLLFHDCPGPATGGMEWLKSVKNCASLLDFISQSLEDRSDLEQDRKESLILFFTSALTFNVETRTTDLSYLTNLLTPNSDHAGIVTPATPDINNHLWEQETLFELERSIVQIAVTDYRLRQFLTTCFEDEVVNGADEACRRHAAFQLAFLLKSGFGTARNDERARLMLSRSGKSTEDLYVHMQIWSQVTVPYQQEHMIELIRNGFVHQSNLVHAYRALGLLADSERWYQREIHEMEIAFPHYDVLTQLKLALSDILESQGRYSEAESILKRVIAANSAFENLSYVYTGDLEAPETRLASIYLNKGMYEEAERLQQESLSRIVEKFGLHHPQSLAAKITLASTLEQLGHYNQAEMMVRDVLHQREIIYGPSHQATLAALEHLSLCLYNQDDYNAAASVMKDVIRGEEKFFGTDHPNTLLSMNNLASILARDYRYKEAEPLCRLALEKTTALLGADHPYCLAATATYGRILFGLDKFEQSNSLYRQALEGEQRVRGKDHYLVLVVMNNLALNLVGLQRFDEAYQVVWPVLQARSPRVVRNRHMLRVFSMLASSFTDHFMLDVGEALIRLAIEGQEAILGATAYDTLASRSVLVTILLERKMFSAAESLSRQSLNDCDKSADTKTQPITMSLINGLAVSLELQERYDEATEIHSRSIKMHETLLGPDHRDTLTCVSNLGVVLAGQGRYVEAEAVQRRAMEGFKKLFGFEHFETLASASNLASTLVCLDPDTHESCFDQAVILFSACVASFTKLYGAGHEFTTRCEVKLTAALKLQHRNENMQYINVSPEANDPP